MDLTGYTDASYGEDVDTRRSTSGYIFTVCGGAVSWKSKKQNIIALSSMESEYITMTKATKEAIWLANIYEDISQTLQNKWELVEKCSQLKWELTDPYNRPDDNDDLSSIRSPTLWTDSQSAIDLAENPKHHDWSKHITI